MFRLTPWSCFDEWSFVYEGLFGECPEAREQALCISDAWICRGENIPPAVETTRALTMAKHTHHQMDGQAARLFICAAIVRFVNENCDVHQQGTHALSITHLAANLGIPRQLVDIRHEATHGCLPSLPSLLMAVDLALEWLLERYWNPSSRFKECIDGLVFDLCEKYREGIKKCDPLRADEQKLIDKLTKQIPSINDSLDVQLAAFESIIKHGGAKDAIIDGKFISHLVSQNDCLLLSFTTFVLLRGCRALCALEKAMEFIDFSIVDRSILNACLKECLRWVPSDDVHAFAVLKAIYKKCKVHLAPKMQTFIQTFSTPEISPKASSKDDSKTHKTAPPLVIRDRLEYINVRAQEFLDEHNNNGGDGDRAREYKANRCDRWGLSNPFDWRQMYTFLE